MDLSFTPEEQSFREQVREFVRTNLPDDIRRKVVGGYRLAKQDFARWQTILYQRGWGAPAWPVKFGGTGWTPIQRHIFDEECALAGAPIQIAFGLKMLAPVLVAFGNEAQQSRFLPKILTGEEFWCQGYSETGAGSDLASVKTTAVRHPVAHGEHYVVNGEKTWNTYGHWADWIFCLVRTGTTGRPQEGISFLLIHMKSPGVSIRPITMLDGDAEICEVRFEDVRVPVDQRVGEENKGWTYAKFLLGHERSSVADVGHSKLELRKLKELARRETAYGRPLIEDVRFRDRMAWVELELMALEMTCLRVLSAEGSNRDPGPAASLLKVRGTEIQQALSELQMQALGHGGLPYLRDALDGAPIADPILRANLPLDFAPLTGRYFNLRKTSIYGGSNEIQRNIIAQAVLGL
jgi:alkylation response protein AidB-like acyl-CoA dehydrogenase